MKQALGLIETIGLAAAIEAADAAVKAANVTLLGYENTKGSGKITVKLTGNVGAVNAGVAAGIAAASRVGEVYGHRVIARPHEEIELLIRNLDRGQGLGVSKTPPAEPVEEQPLVVESAPPEAETSEAETESSDGATAELTGGAAQEASQCAASTKSGERCKLPASPGSAYCFVHQKPAEGQAS